MGLITLDEDEGSPFCGVVVLDGEGERRREDCGRDFRLKTKGTVGDEVEAVGDVGSDMTMMVLLVYY